MEETISTVLEMEARMKRMECRLAAVTKSVHINGLGILNHNVRQFNSQARDPQDQLQPLQIAESNESQDLSFHSPKEFPRTLIEAISLRWDTQRLSQLLEFYSMKILKPGNDLYTSSETEDSDDCSKFIDVSNGEQVASYSKECFTYFISYIGLKRKVVENYLPSTERRPTD